MKGIELTERDIMLLLFLSYYKIISLDNASYIYETVTYQEKRIVKLVKYKYIKRLKHRYITLGPKGKEHLLGVGLGIQEHCRNENNMKRLYVISDIVAFMSTRDTINFSPSWDLKDKEELTKQPRRFIGVMRLGHEDFLTYCIYSDKGKRYITSIHYDIKKETDYKNVIILTTKDIKELMYRKECLSFETDSCLLVSYNDYSKFILRNYTKIINGIYNTINANYYGYVSELEEIDYSLDDGRQIKIMPLVDLKVLRRMRFHFRSIYR